jgi:transposase
MEQFVEGRRGTPVFLGVDTHSDAHVAAALDGAGKLMGGISVPNTEAGYAELLGWASRFGDLVKAGVEGTGSYGAGLSRFLRARSVRVVEVNRTSRQHRRRYGKHDASDAEAAARAVMAGTASGEPKGADGAAESLRVLRVARRSAVKARTQAANQMHALLSTAPEGLKEGLRGLPTKLLAARRPRASGAPRIRQSPPRRPSSPCAPSPAATARSPRRSPGSKRSSSGWQGRRPRSSRRSTASGRTRPPPC